MGNSKTVRGFSASVTPTHFATIPFSQDEPIEDDDRIVPPQIEVRGDEGWFAVTSAPRGERRSLQALKQANLVAYVPMETLWVDEVRLKLKVKREVQRPILPRYIFLRVPDGSPIWYELKREHRDGSNIFGINGVIMNNGQPCRIPTTLLKQLADEERDGWFDQRRRRRHEAERNPVPTGPALMAGEDLRIVGGAFMSYAGKAEADSANGTVRALVEIFGRETLVVVPVDQVENLSREIVTESAGDAPLSRAHPLSDLAQARASSAIDWRVIEERRLRRINCEVMAQRDKQRPLRKSPE